MSCISLNILDRLSRVWPLCAGLQELTNGSAVVGGKEGSCEKEHWKGRVGGRKKERAGGVFKVFYFLKIPS